MNYFYQFVKSEKNWQFFYPYYVLLFVAISFIYKKKIITSVWHYWFNFYTKINK